MLNIKLKIILISGLLISLSSFGQDNRLDIVVKSIDQGKYESALDDLEDIITNATTAVPARAFKYEFNIYRHFMANSKNSNDSSEWHNRMMGSFIGCQEAANPSEVLVYMASVLKQHMTDFDC
jgi:hypothetical protein